LKKKRKGKCKVFTPPPWAKETGLGTFAKKKVPLTTTRGGGGMHNYNYIPGEGGKSWSPEKRGSYQREKMSSSGARFTGERREERRDGKRRKLIFSGEGKRRLGRAASKRDS